MRWQKTYSAFLVSLSLIFSLWTYHGYSHNYQKPITYSAYVIGQSSTDCDYNIFNYSKALCLYQDQAIGFVTFSYNLFKEHKAQTTHLKFKSQRYIFLSIKTQLASTIQLNTTIHLASSLVCS